MTLHENLVLANHGVLPTILKRIKSARSRRFSITRISTTAELRDVHFMSDNPKFADLYQKSKII